MSDLHEEIRKLTQEWYTLIGSDHHKDWDCHFTIETIWSYGDGPRFVPRHYGYIVDRDEFEDDMPRQSAYGGVYKEGFIQYEDALVWLKQRIQWMISKERKHQTDD